MLYASEAEIEEESGIAIARGELPSLEQMIATIVTGYGIRHRAQLRLLVRYPNTIGISSVWPLDIDVSTLEACH